MLPENEETKELLSLMTPLMKKQSRLMTLDPPQEVKGQTVTSQAVTSQSASVAQKSGANPDSELDSDDSLTPCDIS
ncbi:uncharacterized protein [Salvelinus alpinus]|uniref:uncharacterized protein isoform X3 n=1 Tax=Salvelinus alpinus TaxID=8036 RepID=UPI0039FD356A